MVVPVHNGADFLASCIQSILDQGIDDLEIIVVDDGSTDDSLEIARSLSVQVVTQPNAGVSAARNRGFLECTGEFVVFQDQDDRFPQGALDHGRRVLQEQVDCGMAFGRARIIDEHDRAKGEQPARKAPATVEAFLAGDVVVPPGIAMFRHASIVDAGPFDPAWQIVGDLAFYVAVMKVATAVSHDRISVEYRRHGRNVSARGSEVETLRELLAYLGQKRGETNEPSMIRAIDRGRRHWSRRYWRSTVTWGVRSALAGRFAAACVAAGVAVRAIPHRLPDLRGR